jgi:hypothetical protein
MSSTKEDYYLMNNFKLNFIWSDKYHLLYGFWFSKADDPKTRTTDVICWESNV